jgi:uncharacterized repeat protein (TIGR01451 family)
MPVISFAQFEPPQFLLSGMYFNEPTDVDLDGDLDLMFHSGGYYQRWGFGGWMENTGSGLNGFIPHTIETDTLFWLLEIQDVDGDGDPDWIGKMGFEHGWVENTNSTSAWPWHFASPGNYAIQDVFDFDLDGDLDFGTIGPNTPSGMLHFYINDGQGNFNPNPVLYSDHTRYIIPVYNPLTDYDLDGISDGAYHYCAPSGNQCIGGLQVFASSLNFEPVSFFFSDVNYVKALFDFDNSGYADILVSIQEGTEEVCYLYTDPFVLGFNPVLQPALPGSPYVDFIGDFDNDGDYDLMYYDELTWSSAIYEFNGNFEVSDITSIPASAALYYPSELTEINRFRGVDADEDGDMDMVIRGTGHIYLQQENLAYVPFTPFFGLSRSAFTATLHDYGHDINNDGRDELVYHGSNAVYFNEQLDVSSTVPYNNALTAESSFNYWFDINDDGLEDLLMMEDSGIDIYLQTPGGLQHTQYLPVNFGNTVDRLDVIDINGDFARDIVYHVSFNPQVQAIVYNTSANEFDPAPIVIAELGDFASTIEFIDMNTDGRMDLLESPQSWFLNDGNIPMTNMPVGPGLQQIWGFSVGSNININNDGLADYLIQYPPAFEESEPVVTVVTMPDTDILQSGSETFEQTAYNRFYRMDVNNDGLYDFISVNSFPMYMDAMNAFTVYTQGQYGAFTASSALPIPGVPNTAELCGFADIDDDGSEDLIWTSVMYDLGGFDNPSGLYFWSRNTSAINHGFSGRVFIDYNQNGAWSLDEPELNDVTITTGNPMELVIANGYYNHFTAPGEYVIAPMIDEADWSFTTPSQYTITLSDEASFVNSLDFGVFPTEPEIDILPSMNMQSTVCGDVQSETLFVQNNSNVPIDIQVELILDELTTLLGFEDISPYGYAEAGTVNPTWILTQVNPGQAVPINFTLLYPTADFIGQVLNHSLNACRFNLGITEECFNFIYEEPITCSYDPNDMLVEPVGYTNLGFILNDTELTYTIRFQNTGNAPANDVRIEHPMSDNLNPSTFQVLDWSHSLETFIDAEGVAHFYFENINLPDATSDEANSHGYVRYTIRPNEGLAPLTEIAHHSLIYFDLNAPIITNTVTSTIFECGLMGSYLLSIEDVYCSGSQLQLDAGSLNYVDSWSWTLNGEEISAVSEMNTTLNAPGTYSLSLAVSNPYCNPVYEDSFEVIEGLDTPTFTQNGNELTLTGGGPGIQWYLNGNPISGANSGTYTIQESGSYSVSITDGCTAMSTPQDIIYLGVSADDKDIITFYPNPVTDWLTIETNRIAGPAAIRVSDITGRIHDVSAILMHGKVRIDFSLLPRGVYLITIETNVTRLVTEVIRM